MEKLHIFPQKARCMLRHGGNEVLLLTYPKLTGNTPAALHVAALIEALTGYARQVAAARAAEALKAAAASGHLFDFTRHTYDISLSRETTQRHLILALRVRFCAGEEPIFSNELQMLWDKEETVQYSATRTRTRRVPRKAKP